MLVALSIHEQAFLLMLGLLLWAAGSWALLSVLYRLPRTPFVLLVGDLLIAMVVQGFHLMREGSALMASGGIWMTSYVVVGLTMGVMMGGTELGYRMKTKQGHRLASQA